MFRREKPMKRDRAIAAPRPPRHPEDAPYAPPGETQSRERRRRSFWNAVMQSAVIARLW